MDISGTRLVYFSPTGTSKTVVRAIADGLEAVSGREETDLTTPGFKAGGAAGRNELTVVGVPVYAGRVPALAAERLHAIRGNGGPAVIVVVYGNREFEDALLELRDIVTANGFRVVAGAAFIGEHSFSTDELPVAAGRPDSDDVNKAQEFGRSIMQSIGAEDKYVDIPGNKPYREGMKSLPFAPVVDHEACSRCGTCVEICPAGALSLDDAITTDVESCILCAACIKGCPEKAVSLASTPMAEKMVELNRNCSARKEPRLFF